MNIKTPLVHITINSLNLGILSVEKSVAKYSPISRSGKAIPKHHNVIIM